MHGDLIEPVRELAARLLPGLRPDRRGNVLAVENVEHERGERIEQVAPAVAGACGFTSLAIFCVMIGLSFEPRAAFQAGGFLTLLMAAILVLKALEARKKPYRKTEMRLYLPKEHRPPEAYAQWASSTVLHETYLMFARWTAAVSIVMWLLALLFVLFGR